MPDLSTFHLQRMERINSGFFDTGDGLAMVATRSATVDEIVTERFHDAFPPENQTGLAVLAVGGYGRRHLFPHSDVDLLFLFGGESDAGREKERLGRLLTDLWDSQLRVSQSVRTPAECSRIHGDNAELHISLLDARLLAGDRALYEEFVTTRLPRFYLRERQTLLRNLVELTDRRHARFGRTIYHLEPNVKEGPGGLRDLQSACWISQLFQIQPDRVPHCDEVLPIDYRPLVEEGKRFLYSVRCYLHYLNGRDNNHLTFDLQESIAHDGAGKCFRNDENVADWMRDYFRNARVIHRLCSHLIDEAATPTNSLFRFFRDRKSRLSNADFSVTHGRIFLKYRNVLRDRPELVFDLFQFLARHGVPPAPETERRIEESLPAIADYARTDVKLWPVFAEILKLDHAYEALTSMHETGVLTAVFPEFHLIDCLVLRDFYHRYTVDEHTFRTIRVLKELPQTGDVQAARFAELVPELEHPEHLFMALLLHDIGKGAENGGSHADTSVELGAEALKRLGTKESAKAEVLFLVANHLLMSEVVTSRDLNEPGTIDQFVEQVGTLERLKALTLMTFADTSAVHPNAMTTWRKQILWQLYTAAHNRLTGDFEDRRIEVVPADAYLEQAGGEEEKARLKEFLKGFPQRYLRTHDPEEVYLHYQLGRRLEGKKSASDIQRLHSLYQIVVVTWDRPFLFASLCAALSSFGLNIEKAEAFANGQKMALDTFVVSDPNRSLELNPEEVQQVNRTLRRVAEGAAEMQSLLAPRRKAFAPRRRIPLTPEVAYDNGTSSRATIFHVTADDRTGLLYDLASKFSQHECDIEVVLIDTQGRKAIDVFYVVGPQGKLDEEICDLLKKELAAACVSGRA